MRCKALLNLIFTFLLLFSLVTTTSAKRMKNSKKPIPLSSVHIVDRNGFAETITHKDRLNQFQSLDFLQSQPYQKVLRIYARDPSGNIRSIVTSYHPNGNPKQFLEIMNGRAFGGYREWHENGVMAVSAKVVGGTADIIPTAERTWLFDGLSNAWDEDGHIKAEIPYCQGILEGYSIYYYPNGQVSKRIPYHKGNVDGVMELYRENGQLLQQISYVQGTQHGNAVNMWDATQIASQEDYNNGKLECGTYYDQQGNMISEVKQGNGYRVVFENNAISEYQEYRQGNLEGEVKVVGPQGKLKRLYHIKNDIKHGEEIVYFDKPNAEGNLQPKLAFNWVEGKIQGPVKTWYSKGNLESQREMANNKKNGVSTNWYRDGNIMMIEEYDQDKLVKGEYYKKGEKIPVSIISQGKGTATMFDVDGHYIQKIPYVNGKPDE